MLRLKIKIKILDSNENLVNCDMLAWLHTFKGIKQTIIIYLQILVLTFVLFADIQLII